MPAAAGALAAQQHHTVGRKVVDIAQKARGRVPLKYEFEIIPFFAGELSFWGWRFGWGGVGQERGAARAAAPFDPCFSPGRRGVCAALLAAGEWASRWRAMLT